MIDKNNADIMPRQQMAPSPDAYAWDIPTDRETESIGLKEYLAIFGRRFWLMLGLLILTMGIGIIYTLTQRPVYEASARVVAMTTQTTSLPVSENDIPLLGELQALTRSRTVETQVEIMSSPDVIDEAFNRLPKYMRKSGFKSNKAPIWSYKIKSQKGTDVILVTGRAYTPSAAAAFANTIADTYFQHDLRQNNQATRQARIYAGEQMLIAEKKLAEANRQLALFKKNSQFFAPSTQVTEAAQRLSQLSADLTAAKAEAASKRRLVDVLYRKLSGEQPNVITNTTLSTNPQYNSILDRINALHSERVNLLEEYTPQSKEVKAVENKIQAEERRLKNIASNVISSRIQARNPVRDTLSTEYATELAALSAANARVRALESELSRYEMNALTLPDKELKLTQLSEKVALLQRTYEMLSNKYYALLLREQSTLPSGILVSRAKLSDKPKYPNAISNAVLFAVIGLLIAVAAALLAEKVDSKIRDEETLEKLCQLNMLTAIPRVRKQIPQISHNNTNSALLESFRILRNNISLTSIDKPIKILAVTSPGRREGKSTVSINLAGAMAMEGKKVLLIDGDMRCPSLHKYLGLSNDIGLVNAIEQYTIFDELIQRTTMNNVDCITAGKQPPNPSELLNSPQCKEIISELTEKYDVVIIDCPPTVGLSDVQVISKISDALVLVISLNNTLKPHLQIALKSLAMIDAPLIGAVLNGISMSKRSYNYYFFNNKSYGRSIANS